MPARTISKLPPRSPGHETLQPPGWPAPKGYANGIKARGEFVFVGGMVGFIVIAMYLPIFSLYDKIR